MVGMTLGTGVIITMDAAARQEIMAAFNSMIDQPSEGTAA